MTQPPQNWPGGPQDPHQQPPTWPQQPGGWPPPQPPQPQQQPPAWPQQPGATGDIQWAPPAPGAPLPGGQWEQLGPEVHGTPAAKPKGHGKLIGAAVVVVALAGGGVATYAAVSDKNSQGAGSPREAIQKIVGDLNKSDLIGVLEDLAPGERSVLADAARESINQLKRLKVVQQSADPSSVSGVQFRAENLQYAPNTITVNDHVQVVQITGGSVTVGSDLSKVPFTADFLKAAFPSGVPSAKPPARQDIAKGVADNGGPFRFAAQKVDGRWYPSIFYTIADNNAHDAGVTPTQSDYIPAIGAASPEDAVTQVVTDLVKGDVTGAIKLASPDELAVLHDYGGVIAANATYGPLPVTIKDLQLTSTPTSAGVRVMLKKVTVQTDSDEITVVVDGSCIELTQGGQTKKMCAEDTINQLLSTLDQFTGGIDITPAQRTAFEHLLTGSMKSSGGVEVTKIGGTWYVDPVRTYFDQINGLLGNLQGNDLMELIGFFSHLGG